MFTTNLIEFKSNQEELIRRAEHYRLIKAAARTEPLSTRISNLIGSLMVSLGRELVALSGTAR